jgi:hypothetical protein
VGTSRARDQQGVQGPPVANQAPRPYVICGKEPGRPAVDVESRAAGNQEEVPFARSLGGAPNSKASVMITGTGTMIPNRACTLAIRFGPEVGRSVGFDY